MKFHASTKKYDGIYVHWFMKGFKQNKNRRLSHNATDFLRTGSNDENKLYASDTVIAYFGTLLSLLTVQVISRQRSIMELCKY